MQTACNTREISSICHFAHFVQPKPFVRDVFGGEGAIFAHVCQDAEDHASNAMNIIPLSSRSVIMDSNM
jgi:hypothetical protein